jgi:hypothetical protein
MKKFFVTGEHVGERIILKWAIKKYVRIWTGFMWLRIGVCKWRAFVDTVMNFGVS